MKKIVALVLSLVMVLGLATTAMAASAPTVTGVDAGDYYYQFTTKDSTAFATAQEIKYYPAVDPVYNNVTGKVDTMGQIAYYTIANQLPAKYVEVASLAEADVVLYNDLVDGKGNGLFKYLKALKNDTVTYLGNGAAFTDFGKACGQNADPNYDATATYYTFEDEVYKASVAPTGTNLKVDGVLVPVSTTVEKWVGHTVVYTYDKTFKVTGVSCSACGATATIIPNYASVPASAIAAGIVGGPINSTQYYVWNAAPAAPEAPADKVESAQTFDAGIAMYVGMSVMAAAGSAVVLKKKD